MNARHSSPVLIAACVGLFGCFVPEQFDATLEIDKDRNYSFSYDGTLVFAPALSQIKENGSLSVGDEAAMAQGVAELRGRPGVTSVLYVGRGRFKIQYRETGAVVMGRTLFMDLARFEINSAGEIRITSPAVSPGDQKELAELGLKLDGTIRLKSAIPVVEHNATATPWFGGRFGAYKWRITAQGSLPSAVLR
jgi:hypothetical protein